VDRLRKLQRLRDRVDQRDHVDLGLERIGYADVRHTMSLPRFARVRDAGGPPWRSGPQLSGRSVEPIRFPVNSSTV
jgi:hypothetical protein